MRIGIPLLLAVVLAIFVAGCTSVYQQPAQPQQPVVGAEGKTVEITSEGFSPNILTINAGDIVTFVNKDSELHRPASAQHPTHKVYPESGGCIGSTFDSCKNLGQGESWSFTFNQKGEWKYHDHLNCCTDSRFFGTIVVN